MSGDHGKLGAGKHLLRLPQKLIPGHVGQHSIDKDDVRGIRFQVGKSGFGAFSFRNIEADGLSNGHTQAADTLFVVNDQKSDAKIIRHCGVPITFFTTSISCEIRNGFSTHGAPVLISVCAVSSFTMSPVMKTSFETS